MTLGMRLGLVTLVAQAPGSESSSHTGVIVGQVVDAISRRPVADAIVTINMNSRAPDERLGARAASAPLSVMTDDEGRFVLRDLAPGIASITASKSGWLAGAYGRVRPNGSSSSLTLTEHARVRDVEILLWRPAAISGTTRDERGEPMIGASVRALKRVMSGGRQKFVTIAQAQTDDRGAYRFGLLPPAKYIVALTPGHDPSTTTPGLAGLTTWVHRTTFFPNASRSADATVLDLAPDDDRTGVDLQAVTVRAVSVGGRVRGPSGPVANAIPSLMPDDDATDIPTFAGSISVFYDGTFRYFGVPPGQYILSFTREAGAPSQAPLPLSFNRLPSALSASEALWGALPLSVGDTDVTDLTFDLVRPPRVSGIVRFQGPLPAPGPAPPIRLLLEPADGHAKANQLAVVLEARDQEFAGAAPPGRYVVRTETSAAWKLESAMLGGRDVSDTALDIRGDEVAGLVVTLARDLPEITGSISGVSSAVTVVFFPADVEQWRDYGSSPRRLRLVRADASGIYRSGPLPPGAYFVAAIPEERAPEELDPDTLTSLARVATRVDLGRTGVRDLQLPVRQWR